MSCYQFLEGGIIAIIVGVVLVIYSDKDRSDTRPSGKIGIKVSGGLLTMMGILVLIGSLVGLSSGCLPQSIA